MLYALRVGAEGEMLLQDMRPRIANTLAPQYAVFLNYITRGGKKQEGQRDIQREAGCEGGSCPIFYPREGLFGHKVDFSHDKKIVEETAGFLYKKCPSVDGRETFRMRTLRRLAFNGSLSDVLDIIGAEEGIEDGLRIDAGHKVVGMIDVVARPVAEAFAERSTLEAAHGV